MKAHELARKLLEGPDLPVIHYAGEPPYLEEITGITLRPIGEPWSDTWYDTEGIATRIPAVELR